MNHAHPSDYLFARLETASVIQPTALRRGLKRFGFPDLAVRVDRIVSRLRCRVEARRTSRSVHLSICVCCALWDGVQAAAPDLWIRLCQRLRVRSKEAAASAFGASPTSARATASSDNDPIVLSALQSSLQKVGERIDLRQAPVDD